jgi:hypothetical protein
MINEISTRFYNQSWSWHYARTVAVDESSNKPGIRIKVEICRNAYDQQSYGRTYIWSGSKWELVVNVPIEGLLCKHVSYTHNKYEVNRKAFEKDADDLLDETIRICAPA